MCCDSFMQDYSQGSEDNCHVQSRAEGRLEPTQSLKLCAARRCEHLWSCHLTTSAASDVKVQCTCTMQASTHLRTHDVQGVHQKVSSAAPHPSKFGTTLN